ncbi:glycosyltransferase family 4 protein [Parasphingorhabdus sp.]|uniref:glycosyltransferase family 4 protein n=1 Tax=Parasphingorhabdus sp. TaxID=2709688 RepID=UPI0032635591
MNNLPKIVHLLDDISLGGVTKSLELFRNPTLERHYSFSVEEVHPEWSIAPRFDASAIVVHFSVSWKTMPFLYSLASKNPKAKLILMQHSYSEEWEQINVPEKGRFRSMLKLAHRVFDRVICVSEAQAMWLQGATGLEDPKLAVIYPWSDMQGLAQLFRPHFSQKDPITIGTYGRFVQEKGFEQLINAFNSLGEQSEVKLRIGGFGPDETKLKQLAADNANISFFGKVGRLADFYKQCDIIAVPSQFEAYGLVATEARLAARPIFVSNAGGLPEQVSDAGLVVDFEDNAVVVRLLKQIRHLPLVQMSVAGRDDCLRVTEQRIEAWLDMLSKLELDKPQLKAA